MTVVVQLTQGKVAVVDDRDAALVSLFRWYAARDKWGKWYARASVNQQKFEMHRVLTTARRGELVDHIDGDGLNNTRKNLRKCDHRQNGWNRGMTRNNTSGHKGAFRCGGRWHACITVNGRRMFLGAFASAGEAGCAYAEAARKLHGEFFAGRRNNGGGNG